VVSDSKLISGVCEMCWPLPLPLPYKQLLIAKSFFPRSLAGRCCFTCTYAYLHLYLHRHQWVLMSDAVLITYSIQQNLDTLTGAEFVPSTV